MFIKITESGCRRYAKLAEAYRDERGIGRQRIIANLGRVDALQSSASTLGNPKFRTSPTVLSGFSG